MLLEIACTYGERLFGEQPKWLNLTLSAWEDINWKLRKLAANRLKLIIPHWKTILAENEEIYNTFVEKFEELMTDEENLVKIDMFETIVTWIPYFKKVDVETKFLDHIKDIFKKDTKENEEFIFPISLICGKLFHVLNEYELVDALK